MAGCHATTKTRACAATPLPERCAGHTAKAIQPSPLAPLRLAPCVRAPSALTLSDWVRPTVAVSSSVGA